MYIYIYEIILDRNFLNIDLYNINMINTNAMYLIMRGGVAVSNDEVSVKSNKD